MNRTPVIVSPFPKEGAHTHTAPPHFLLFGLFISAVRICTYVPASSTFPSAENEYSPALYVCVCVCVRFLKLRNFP